jgi:hypothetical protein
MATPTVVGVGTVDSATPWVPGLPAGTALDDILFLLVEQIGGEASPAATGYAHVTGSPVVQGVNTQLSVLWKRAGASESAPTVTGPSDHAVTRIIGIRGGKTAGNPWSQAAVAVESIADTSAAWPGVTTLVAGCLILECIATGRDIATTANLGALTNSLYTSITEQMDNWDATGGGGGIGLVTGIKTTAGATGSSTATMASTDTKAMMTIALDGAADMNPKWTLTRSPRPSETISAAGPYAAPNQSSIFGG